MLFDHSYQQSCLDAIAHPSHGFGNRREDLCSLIEEHFASLFEQLLEGRTAVQLRCDHMESVPQQWSAIKSTSTCLFCLHHRPEHILSCGHALCETCVSRFGAPRSGVAYRYEIDSCKLCMAKVGLQIRLKPPTAGPRLLSVDGGGIKGVVALEFLLSLKEALGPYCPFEDTFDSVVGTSSGMIIWLIIWRVAWFIDMVRRLHYTGPLRLRF